MSYTNAEPNDYENRLRAANVDEESIWYLSLLTAIIKNNEYDIASSDLEQLLGRKPTDLKTYLKETFLA
ncbi:hypothetical protein D3C85_1883350 [compost metagenome]